MNIPSIPITRSLRFAYSRVKMKKRIKLIKISFICKIEAQLSSLIPKFYCDMAYHAITWSVSTEAPKMEFEERLEKALYTVLIIILFLLCLLSLTFGFFLTNYFSRM